MKPGDLVTIRAWNITYAIPIEYVNVYERIDVDEDNSFVWKWERGENGILLEGRDDRQEMVQVLHKGRVGWIDEEFLKVIDEAG